MQHEHEHASQTLQELIAEKQRTEMQFEIERQKLCQAHAFEVQRLEDLIEQMHNKFLEYEQLRVHA